MVAITKLRPRVTARPASQVTLEQTQKAMQELIIPGKVPNGKLAFYFAICTIRTRLTVTGRYAKVLRGYADNPLPVNHDELRAKLPGIMETQLEALYAVENLWNVRIIHFNTGSTFQEQFIWRETMTSAIPGMGHKTVSFALHIFNPERCLLLTVDCWHIRRIRGLGTNESLPRKKYLDIEQVLREDITCLAEQEGQGFWTVTYAACLWERTRQGYGASECCDGEYQSHAELSCYL